jgi:DNA-directed RNA polymerase subunit N (RpoN/RPB10)
MVNSSREGGSEREKDLWCAVEGAAPIAHRQMHRRARRQTFDHEHCAPCEYALARGGVWRYCCLLALTFNGFAWPRCIHSGQVQTKLGEHYADQVQILTQPLTRSSEYGRRSARANCRRMLIASRCHWRGTTPAVLPLAPVQYRRRPPQRRRPSEQGGLGLSACRDWQIYVYPGWISL